MMAAHRSNNLTGPRGPAFEVEHEARIVALREEYIRARALADGLEIAWKRSVEAYLPILEKKAGFIKGNAYTFPQDIAERVGSKTATFIYSHVEAYEWASPGFFFWTTTTKGARSKWPPRRLFGLDEASRFWRHAPLSIQDTERPSAK